MIDHVGLPVADLDASVRFYTAVLAPLDSYVNYHDEEGASFGSALYLTPANASSPGQMHVALKAPDKVAVDRFYEQALASGGRDNGAPGERPDYGDAYYAAYVFDPDGNNIEAVCSEA